MIPISLRNAALRPDKTDVPVIPKHKIPISLRNAIGCSQTGKKGRRQSWRLPFCIYSADNFRNTALKYK